MLLESWYTTTLQWPLTLLGLPLAEANYGLDVNSIYYYLSPTGWDTDLYRSDVTSLLCQIVYLFIVTGILRRKLGLDPRGGGQPSDILQIAQCGTLESVWV